jgi:N-acetylglucosamine-6-phosphate deacetylase
MSTQHQPLAIKARRGITPLQDVRDVVVLIEDGKVAAVGPQGTVPIPDGARVIDVGGRCLVPGFIDLHHHGAVGVMAGDGAQAVKQIAQYLVKTGTTSWLPTLLHPAGLPGVVAAKRDGTGGADVAGIHMEGPFLAPKRVPGQEAMDSALRPVSIAEFTQLVEAAEGNLKLMGLAPELPGALDLIREARRVGVMIAVAHTKGTYEQFMRAVEAGARHVTHAFNVMTGMHHRKPGVMGGVLTCDQVTAELIADGYHVSPVAMDVLIRCKGVDRVAVITDAVSLSGLPDGTYKMLGRTVVKQNGISRLAGTTAEQDNTMAGSEWPMNHNIHNLVSLVGLRLRDAIRMATLTPATIAGLQHTKGSIEPGKDADLVVIDDQVHVYMTLVRGNTVFQEDRL